MWLWNFSQVFFSLWKIPDNGFVLLMLRSLFPSKRWIKVELNCVVCSGVSHLCRWLLNFFFPLNVQGHAFFTQKKNTKGTTCTLLHCKLHWLFKSTVTYSWKKCEKNALEIAVTVISLNSALEFFYLCVCKFNDMIYSLQYVTERECWGWDTWCVLCDN